MCVRIGRCPFPPRWNVRVDLPQSIRRTCQIPDRIPHECDPGAVPGYRSRSTAHNQLVPVTKRCEFDLPLSPCCVPAHMIGLRTTFPLHTIDASRVSPVPVRPRPAEPLCVSGFLASGITQLRKNPVTTFSGPEDSFGASYRLAGREARHPGRLSWTPFSPDRKPVNESQNTTLCHPTRVIPSAKAFTSAQSRIRSGGKQPPPPEKQGNTRHFPTKIVGRFPLNRRTVTFDTFASARKQSRTSGVGQRTVPAASQKAITSR
jgi:hypothetical protein